MAACMSCIESGCSVPKAKRLKRHYEDTGDFASCLLGIEYGLCEDLLSMTFPEPVSFVYSPLDYAAETHQSFVRTYGNSTRDVLFLGMNPGPFGMAQNGVSASNSTAPNGLPSTPLCQLDTYLQALVFVYSRCVCMIRICAFK